jgi:hypothetical protein
MARADLALARPVKRRIDEVLAALKERACRPKRREIM